MRMQSALLLMGFTASLVLVFSSASATSVYAQDGTEQILKQHQYLFAGLAFISAGLFYSCMGIVKRARRALAGEPVKLDPRKMAKSVTLGIVLGIAGMILHFANTGELITVSSHQEFASVFGIATASIVAVDKILLQRPSPKVSGQIVEVRQTEIPTPMTPTERDDDLPPPPEHR